MSASATSSVVRVLGYGTVRQTKVMNTVLVKEVMTTDVQTIGPEGPLSEAARLMSSRKLGCLPVVQDGKLVGILTEGDFVAHLRSSARADAVRGRVRGPAPPAPLAVDASHPACATARGLQLPGT